MGTTCSLHRVSVAEIDAMLKDPDSMDRILGLDDGPPVREVRPRGLLGLLLRLTPIRITEVDPDAPESSYDIDPENEIDIEKGWHGLQFVFTGTAYEGREPACYLVKGGEDIDDDGFAHALRPDQVKRFSTFLQGITRDAFDRRYDPKRMMDLKIYPEIWERPVTDVENPKEWLFACLGEVQSFVKRVADADDGMVIHIS